MKSGPTIYATADTHGTLPEVPPCDVLLVGGDVTPVHDHTPHVQRNYLRGEFSDWLREAPAEHIVGIAGNHDFIAEKDIRLMRSLPWTYLCDGETTVAGLRVYGTPWVPNLPGWAFYGGDSNCSTKWGCIPDGIDILLSHGPMRGKGDTVGPMFGGPTPVGCPAMLDVVARVKPKAFICGHIHEGFGHYNHAAIAGGIYNVSHNNENYEPVNPVVRVELTPLATQPTGNPESFSGDEAKQGEGSTATEGPHDA